MGIALNILGLIQEGSEIEDRHVVDLECTQTYETHRNTSEFNKQSQVILLQALKGGRPLPRHRSD